MIRLLVPIVVLLVVVVVAIALIVLPRSSTEVGPVSGRVGLIESGPEPADLPEFFTSPSGQRIRPGTVDPQGYTLPLDIKRPRPPRESPPPPDAATRRQAREGRAGTFEEHRLGSDDGHTHNETVIDAVGDTLVAGWNNFTDSGLVMGVAYSHDGGHVWTSDLLTGGHDALSDPVVKAGGNGVWYFGYIARGGSGGNDFDVFVQRSTNGGAAWNPPVNATDNTGFDDKPFMDADGDDVVVAYADFSFSPAKVSVTRSIDGALTFGNNTVLANNSVGGNGAHPVIGPDGTWYVFWRDSFQDSLWVSRSTDRGINWSPDRGIVSMTPLPSSMPGGFRMVNLPIADANPVTGTLVVVWNDSRFGNPDILSIRSVDNGLTWSDPIQVNDDAGMAEQFFPWIAIDAAGTIHVVWYDRRQDGFDIDVYYARSQDDGLSFDSNVRVTAQSYTPILPWEGGAASFIGDYNAVVANVESVFPFYQDARSGFQEVYVSLLPNDFVSVPEGVTPPPTIQLSATPNPFRGTTRLGGLEETVSGEIEIVTVDGRVVRHLSMGASGEVRWDGRGDGGQMLAPGIYFARVKGLVGSTRLVKLD